MDKTDWQALKDARLAEIDEEIVGNEKWRADYQEDAKKCTVAIDALRRERASVERFSAIGRAKAGAETDSAGSLALDGTGETALDAGCQAAEA